MDKAYDLKVLLERLKELGLDVGEETARELFEVLFTFIEDSAKVSPNLYDDMIVATAKPFKRIVLDAIDKINGKVD